MPDVVLARLQAIMPAHVTDALLLTLYFGLRRGEAFSLKVSQIDWQLGGIWLSAEGVKNNSDDFMPGAPDAMALLRQLADAAAVRGTPYLIAYGRAVGGKRSRQWPKPEATVVFAPIKSPKRAWRTAMNAIAAEFGTRWRWHDLRAAYITQIALTAGPVAAQRLARHASYATTSVYIDVADDVRRHGAAMAAQRPALAAVSARSAR